MTEDELSIYQKGIEQGMKHCKTAPETDKRISLQEQRLNGITDALEDIKNSIDSTKRWIIGTLFGLISAALYFGFSVGTWKGGIEERLSHIETEFQYHIESTK